MYSVRITNKEADFSWTKVACTKEEYDKIRDLCKNRAVVFPGRAALIPVRTNRLSTFAKDFIAPTFFNHALKVNDFVPKLIAILAALVVDAVTLIARVVTVIPRAYRNYKQPEHELLKYLKELKVEGIAKVDNVVVQTMSNSEDKESEWNVNFIQQPYYKGWDRGEFHSPIRDETNKSLEPAWIERKQKDKPLYSAM